MRQEVSRPSLFLAARRTYYYPFMGCTMVSWYKVSRTDWIVQDEFESAWLSNGGPRDAALFGQRNVQARKTDFYFTPAAAERFPELLSRYEAVACSRPNVSELALLVGDQSVLEVPS